MWLCVYSCSVHHAHCIFKSGLFLCVLNVDLWCVGSASGCQNLQSGRVQPVPYIHGGYIGFTFGDGCEGCSNSDSVFREELS